MAKKKHATKKTRSKKPIHTVTLASAQVGLAGAPGGTLDDFDRALQQLEHDASNRVSTIVSTTAEDAAALTLVLRELLATSEAAMKDSLSEIDAVHGQLRDRFAQIEEETEGLRVATQHARIGIETAATEFGARARANLEEVATQHEEELGNVATGTIERITSLGAAMEEHSTMAVAHVEHSSASAREALESILAAAERERSGIEAARAEAETAASQVVGIVAQLRDRAAGQIDVTCRRVADFSSQCEQELERASAALSRTSELSAQAEVDAEGIRARRLQCDELANLLVVHEAAARDRADEAAAEFVLLREYLTTAAEHIEQLPRDADGARLLAYDSVDQTVEEPPEEHFSSEDWASDPTDALLPANDMPASTSTRQIALLEPVTDNSDPRPLVAGCIAATGPVTVVASLASLTACVAELGRGAATSVRIAVSHAKSDATGMAAHLQLVTYDPSGWWERIEMPVGVDATETAPVVVDLREFGDALEAIDQFVGGSDARLQLDGNVTVGNHLLLARAADDVPPMSDDFTPIERIELRATNQLGVVLETQAGRLFVSPELLGHLRHREVGDIQLVSIDGAPCLSARGDTVATAQNEITIVGRLEMLGEHDEPTVSERRNARGDEVTQLVNALSVDATQEQLERILKVGVGYTRRRAATHPSLPQDVIEDLIRWGTEAMRAAAAANENISAEAAQLAIADASPVVRAAIAANRSVPAHCLEQLSTDPVPHVRAQVAWNATTGPDLLDRFVEDHDSFVRAAIASRANVAIETLVVLARDPDSMVCRAVAANSACPSAILADLVSIVPDSVLANPNAAPNLLVAGSAVNAARLRETVAKNPATPVKGLRRLARDNDPNVLRAVSEHPGTPLSVRRRARRGLAAK